MLKLPPMRIIFDHKRLWISAEKKVGWVRGKKKHGEKGRRGGEEGCKGKSLPYGEEMMARAMDSANPASLMPTGGEERGLSEE